MQPRRNRRPKRIRTLETLEKRNLLFAPVDQATLLGGLDTLAETFDRVESHAEYAEAIPSLQSPVGQLADFSEAVRGGLIDPLSSLLDGTAIVDLSDVSATLDGFVYSGDDSTITVVSGSVSTNEIDDASTAAVEIKATIQQVRTVDESLGGLDDVAWMSWADGPEVELTASTEMTITVGVDLVSEEFYAKIGEVTTNISVATTSLDAVLNVGPVSTSIADGVVNIDATLVADFGTAAITANNLQGSTPDSLVSVAASGSLDASLPAEFTLGSYAGSETITWQDSLAFDGIIELPALSDTGDLIAAIRVDTEDLRGFLKQIGTKLDELLGEDLPNFSQDFMPWVQGLKLPDLSNVSQQISDFADQRLTSEDAGPSFSTFEELRQLIETWTNRDTILSYLPESSTLAYEFEFPAPFDVGGIDMGVDRDFGTIAGVDVTGTVNAAGEFVLSGVFGVDLNALIEDTTPSDISDDDSWADHFFVDDLQLAASVDIGSESASAAARLGFVGMAIADVGLSASASASLGFSDDQSSDGRITFKRLSEAIVSDPLSLVESSTLDGNAEVSLTQMSVDGIPGLELDDGEITIGIADITDPSTFTVEVNEAVRNINTLSTVTIDQWVDLAGDVIAMVDDLTSGGMWDQDLPGIGQSVNDLLDHASRLQQAVEELLETDEATIQELGERLELLLEDALRLSPELLDVALSWQADSLQMMIDYEVNEQASLPLSIDMAELIAASSGDTTAFDLLGDLVDVGGQTSVDALASLDGTLAFGVDASEVIAGNASVLTFFVNDSTGLDAELEIAATDLAASVAIGPLGLFIEDGSVTIDSDGDPTTVEPARLSVGLSEVASGRYSVADIRSLESSNLDVVFDAGASIVLPLYFPTVDDPVGGSAVDQANAIVAGIGNVAGLFNSEDPNVTLQAPDINTLVDDFDPLDEGLRILADGLDALLQRIETLLRERVLNQNLPMVGEQLESAADFLQQVREDALPILRDRLQPQQLVDEIKLVLHDALGSVMLLSDINDDGQVDYQDVDLTIDTASGQAELNLSLGGSYIVSADIDFDLGLPGLGLDLDGGVAASLDWGIDLGIGVNSVDGFYLNTSDANEIELDVEVTLPEASLTGTLGLFQISVADQGSSLEGHFDVDLLEPSGDGKLTLAELLSGTTPLGDLVNATLSGGANVDLALVAGTTIAALPEIHADLVLDWSFDGANLLGSVDRLAIENIELDLGSFISGFAGDILGRVQSVLSPIEPIVDILTTPLPVANDLEFLVDTFAAATAPYDAVNLLDLASLLGNVDVEMLDAIVQIVDLVNSIPVPAAGESVMIPLGEVVIVGSASDPSAVSSETATIEDTDIADELADYSGSEEQERFAQESASFIDKMSSISGGGFQFPILDNPASLIGVLLGQDATLFAYKTPRLVADFAMGVTIPITGPLAIELVGGIGVDAQFSFGYDTLGLRKFVESKDVFDLADGFFISDRENADGTGADVAELNLRGSLEAFASLTAGVASASIGGGIYATVGANLNDNDADGKVRLQEFVGNLPLCAFDFAGSLSAGLRMKAQVLGVPFSQNIATIKLLEFSHSCSPAQSLSLGEIDSDGVYTLFVGDQADRREVGEGIVDEFVTFSTVLDADGNEAVEVSGFGITETVRDVTKIVAHAGDGDDSLVVVGSLNVPVEFFGEQGNDELVGGSAADELRGGGDDDLIQGGGGDDAIFGGAGTNTLEGGGGNDVINGGDRDDFIDGGDGDDAIFSGGGRDLVLGGLGSDTIHAGDGDDQVFGGFGIDIVYAGAGNDEVDGGDGDDAIEGEDGDDILKGRAGNDFLRGGNGFDEIYGHAGNDIAFGGYDADSLFGGGDDDVLIGGNDLPINGPDNSDDVIAGNDGNDVMIGDDGAVLDFDGDHYIIEVLAGNGDDHIDGGDGNDWAHGVGGSDEIHGGEGNDHLIGGDAADQIFGDSGSDWLEGNDGDDLIFGHAGGDLIAGGRGVDMIDGGDDEDQLYAHEIGGAEPWYVNPIETEDDAAADVLLGRAGSDEIVGGAGDDFIDGGAGSDAILDRGGNDTVEGGLGNDYIETTLGFDRVVGQWGDDEISLGTDGFTRLAGQHANKNPLASRIPNEANNKVLVNQAGLQLDFVDTSLAESINDIDRIDASFAAGFNVRLDRDSIQQITDGGDTLRLDIATDADATLSGAWVEQEGETIDGIDYRRLTSEGVTLIVRDLKPLQRSGDHHDVNGDGEVSPLDALIVINRLEQDSGRQEIVLAMSVKEDQADVSGDNRVTARDALLVINEFARRSPTETGESELGVEAISITSMPKTGTPDEMTNDEQTPSLF